MHLGRVDRLGVGAGAGVAISGSGGVEGICGGVGLVASCEGVGTSVSPGDCASGFSTVSFGCDPEVDVRQRELGGTCC